MDIIDSNWLYHDFNVMISSKTLMKTYDFGGISNVVEMLQFQEA